MNRRVMTFLGMLLLVTVVGCESQRKRPQAQWVTAAGAAPSPASFEAARAACKGSVAQEETAGRRFNHIQWAVRMLDCMKGKGFFLVEADDEGE